MQEHERAAGAWQAEWDAIAGALAAAGGAAASMAEVLGGLHGRSRADGSQPGAHARPRPLGAPRRSRSPSASARPTRKALVSEAGRAPRERGTTLRDELEAVRAAADARRDSTLAFVPETYVGAADVFIDRALDLYRECGGFPA